MIAFTMLKAKIASTPLLKHFDPDRIPVVVVYASKWAISAALMQEHDGVYWSVMFTSRTLKPNEINYGIVDKEVLALLRILDVCSAFDTGVVVAVFGLQRTTWSMGSALVQLNTGDQEVREGRG
jgi:hypothetical protein